MTTCPDPSCWHLFTDGACLGNPGPGGWAFVLKDQEGRLLLEQAGGQPRTTNNRMELTAVIQGLQAFLQQAPATGHPPLCLWTDSRYVAGGLTQWLADWKKRQWRKADRKPVLNADLWKELDGLAGRCRLQVQWVPGHSGHPENERCDALAVAQAEKFMPDPQSPAP